MISHPNPDKRFYNSGLQILILGSLILGIFFRLTHIDTKIYSFDETYTSLRLSGYTATEFKQGTANKLLSIEDLEKYKGLNAEKTALDTIRALAEDDPQHPPLYFLLLRIWSQWFGNSVVAIRSLSVLISLLVFPAIYYLCLELFQSSWVGWMAILLMANSPFHILYAQEAREYSLWTVTILLSSTLFLQAIRKNTKLSWLIYSGGLIAGLYTFPFTLLVMIGHGIYIAYLEGFRFTKKAIYYLLSSGLGLLIFSPWVILCLSNSSQINSSTSWAQQNVGLKTLLRGWTYAFSSIFYDTNIDWQYRCNTQHWQYWPIWMLLPLILYSILFLFRHSPKPVFIFLIASIGIPFLFIALPDVILGGRRSLMARYLIPSYLGIQLVVAYLFETILSSPSVKTKQKQLWQLILAILVTLEIISCAASAQAGTWWNKYNDSIQKVADLINQAERPLIITDYDYAGTALSLSYKVHPGTKFYFSEQLLSQSQINELSQLPSVSDIFLVNASDRLLEQASNKDYQNQFIQLDDSWCIPMWSGFYKMNKRS